MPLLGWYGDDFTGATDTLACLAEAGLRSMLFPRVPSPAHIAAAGPLDALGIAGATRAMTPDAMAAELAPVARFFAASDVRVLHYKCCSTFDSAPAIGSIGAAMRCLHPYFPNPLLPILGGQPNIGRYCLFSHLFASAGSGGAVHRRHGWNRTCGGICTRRACTRSLRSITRPTRLALTGWRRCWMGCCATRRPRS
jgi:uncharacterized protein YgbK (DUF1537 family)